MDAARKTGKERPTSHIEFKKIRLPMGLPIHVSKRTGLNARLFAYNTGKFTNRQRNGNGDYWHSFLAHVVPPCLFMHLNSGQKHTHTSPELSARQLQLR